MIDTKAIYGITKREALTAYKILEKMYRQQVKDADKAIKDKGKHAPIFLDRASKITYVLEQLNNIIT